MLRSRAVGWRSGSLLLLLIVTASMAWPGRTAVLDFARGKRRARMAANHRRNETVDAVVVARQCC